MLKVSDRGLGVVASPIRKFLPYVLDAENQGVKVLKINVGDPDLEMPPEFMETIKAYSSKTLGYAPSPGFEDHAKAWQKYYRQFGVNLSSESIIPTVGCAEAIMLALLAVADHGDEVIVFEPLYTCYKPFATMAGITLVPVTLPFANDFVLPSIDVVREKITSRTKAIVLINPDNPTGKLWSEDELDLIVDLAFAKGLFVISDETYREFRYDGENPVCLLGRREAWENIIIVDSTSKRYNLTGARIGCIASYNAAIMHSVLKFAQARLSTGTLEQLGTIPPLENGGAFVQRNVEEYKQRRQIVLQGLAKIEGAVFKPAMGAFYQAVALPVDSAEEFVKFMIRDFRHEGKTVMVTPMKDFYITPGLGLSEIRIAYCLNQQALATAMDLLDRGIKAYNAQG